MTVDFFFAGLPPVNCCILSLKLIECSSFRKRDGVGLSLLSSSVSFLSFKPSKLKEVGTLQQIMSWAHHGISLQYERVCQQNGKHFHIAFFGPHLRLNYLQESSNFQHCRIIFKNADRVKPGIFVAVTYNVPLAVVPLHLRKVDCLGML